MKKRGDGFLGKTKAEVGSLAMGERYSNLNKVVREGLTENCSQ